jgi:PIN domain nuclease of toxin-antitoxin system
VSATVLDASAILCVLGQEPGAEIVAKSIASSRCLLSSVNLGEVATKLALTGLSATEIGVVTDKLGVNIVDFDREQAIAAGALVSAAKAGVLSLGDRACIQLAQSMNAPVLTSDRVWATLGLAVKVKLIR